MPPSNASFAALLAVSVGLPRSVLWRGEEVETGIFKSPVSGRVHAKRGGLVGDGQADLSVHGGPDKAVYAYDQSGIDYWCAQLGRGTLSPGTFGENLTLRGAPEEAISIGDILAIGDAHFEVSQPRQPCFKLGLRFEDPRFPKRFLTAGRVGYYLRVLKEGEIGGGDEVQFLHRDERPIRILDLVMAAFGLGDRAPEDTAATLENALAHPALAKAWKASLAERLKQIAKRQSENGLEHETRHAP